MDLPCWHVEPNSSHTTYTNILIKRKDTLNSAQREVMISYVRDRPISWVEGTFGVLGEYGRYAHKMTAVVDRAIHQALLCQN